METRRTGLLVKKVGMSSLYMDDGSRIAVTLLKLDECQVLGVKNVASHGYNAVQLCTGNVKIKNVSKSVKGTFAKSNIECKRKIKEFRVSTDASLEVGTIINVDHFVKGQYVDVTGVSVGKGFAGAMKRWNFRGLEASHGVSVSHRSHGSTGQRQDPGKVFKGKKMAGHLGSENVTLQNLQVISTNIEEGIIVVKGSVPGFKGNYVIIKDAVKRALPDHAPFPASITSNNSTQELKEEGNEN